MYICDVLKYSLFFTNVKIFLCSIKMTKRGMVLFYFSSGIREVRILVQSHAGKAYKGLKNSNRYIFICILRNCFHSLKCEDKKRTGKKIVLNLYLDLKQWCRIKISNLWYWLINFFGMRNFTNSPQCVAERKVK